MTILIITTRVIHDIKFNKFIVAYYIDDKHTLPIDKCQGHDIYFTFEFESTKYYHKLIGKTYN